MYKINFIKFCLIYFKIFKERIYEYNIYKN